MSESARVSGKAEAFWALPERLDIRERAEDRAPPLTAQSVLDALGDHHSRAVLAACIDAPRSVKDICQAAGLPLATTYRQVHRLMELGLLLIERSAMTPEGKKYDLFRSRIAEAHLDLVSGHEQVRWVANDATEGRLSGLWDAVRAQARRP